MVGLDDTVPVHSKNRRRKQHSKSQNMNSKVSNKRFPNSVAPSKVEETDSSSILPMMDEISSSFEESFINIHQNLCTATLYTIRALQLDCGGQMGVDFDCDSNCKILDLYTHRLGHFVTDPYSPLAHSGGLLGSFHSWKAFVTGDVITGHPTNELYEMASKAFKQVECMIQITLNSHSAGHEVLQKLINFDFPIGILTGNLGPSDELIHLQQLAKHNSIACRVLGTHEDRRPTRQVNWNSIVNPPNSESNKESSLSSTSSVRLDYNFLESRTYPLVRIVKKN